MEGPSESLPEAPDAGLVSYLATHDAECPRCRYNLRGVGASRCPECGTTLKLSLERPRRLGGWGPFLLVVFAWLLLAGSMSSARNYRSLREQQSAAAQGSARTLAVRALLAAQLASMNQQLPPAALPSDPRFPGLQQMRQFQVQSQANMNAMLAQSLKSQMASIPAAAPAPSLLAVWRGSGWQAQAGSVWSAAQALGGLLGLVALGMIAARGGGPLRPLVVFACTLGALYAGWHIFVFVNEMR